MYYFCKLKVAKETDVSKKDKTLLKYEKIFHELLYKKQLNIVAAYKEIVSGKAIFS